MMRSAWARILLVVWGMAGFRGRQLESGEIGFSTLSRCAADYPFIPKSKIWTKGAKAAFELANSVRSKLHTLRVMLNFVAAGRSGTCCPTDVGVMVVCRA